VIDGDHRAANPAFLDKVGAVERPVMPGHPMELDLDRLPILGEGGNGSTALLNMGNGAAWFSIGSMSGGDGGNRMGVLLMPLRDEGRRDEQTGRPFEDAPMGEFVRPGTSVTLGTSRGEVMAYAATTPAALKGIAREHCTVALSDDGKTFTIVNHATEHGTSVVSAAESRRGGRIGALLQRLIGGTAVQS